MPTANVQSKNHFVLDIPATRFAYLESQLDRDYKDTISEIVSEPGCPIDIAIHHDDCCDYHQDKYCSCEPRIEVFRLMVK